MDCKEAEKLISAFIEKKLNHKQLKQFLAHVDTCPECREELTIQFLISEGMVRLEQGSAFDLQKELDARMDAAAHEIRMHNTVKYIGVTLEVVAMLAIVVIIFMVLL